MKFSRYARLAFVASMVLFAGYALAGSPAPAGYHLIKKVSFGAAPGVGATREYFDYVVVDSAARRVYLSHGTEIIVVNADTGEKVGAVTGDWKRVHGVALVPASGPRIHHRRRRGQHRHVRYENAQSHQDHQGRGRCRLDHVRSRVETHVCLQRDSKSSTVIDPVKGEVVKSIPLGGAPEQAVSDGKGMIYDNLASTSEIVAIDTKTLTIKSRFPVAPSGQPTSIAMDRKTRRLFVGGRKPTTLVMMDADTGKIIGDAFPIGDRVDANTFDPSTNTVAAAARAGTLHIFHEDSPDKLSVVETMKTEFGAKTMGLDPKTGHLYLTTSDFGPTPAPTEKEPDPQPMAKPGTFRLLIYGR